MDLAQFLAKGDISIARGDLRAFHELCPVWPRSFLWHRDHGVAPL